MLAQATDEQNAKHSERKSSQGNQGGLRQNDAMEVARRRPEHAQDGKLIDMVEGGRVERLRFDHHADNNTQSSAEYQRDTDFGPIEPARDAATAKLGFGEDLRIQREAGRDLLFDLGDVGAARLRPKRTCSCLLGSQRFPALWRS